MERTSVNERAGGPTRANSIAMQTLSDHAHRAGIERSSASQVAMLLQGDEVYGIGTILKLYAAGLPELTFIALRNGCLVEWLKSNGNRVEVVPGRVDFYDGGPSVGVLLKVPGVMRQARRDAAQIDAVLRPRGIRVIHAHWRGHQIIAGCLRRRGYQSIWHINYTMNRRRLMGLGVELNHRLARWGADLLLPASDAIARNWIGCGVPMTTLLNAAIPVYSQPNVLPETPVRCVVAGRLEHSKGHHLAVEAVIGARQAGLDVCLDVYGGPVENSAYANQLRERIAAAGYSEHIRLLGFRTDLRERHQEYHLGFQCRIDAEPCSLWVCETLVDGLPLIASATGGTPELVEDGRTGLLFPSDDVDAARARLIEMASDPPRLRAMRAAAFERGQQMFTLRRFVDETQAAYELLAKLHAESETRTSAKMV